MYRCIAQQKMKNIVKQYRLKNRPAQLLRVTGSGTALSHQLPQNIPKCSCCQGFYPDSTVQFTALPRPPSSTWLPLLGGGGKGQENG